MESIIGIIENSGAPKILVLVGLALFILSIVRQITWLQLLDSSRAVARYTGIGLVAVGVYLEYIEPKTPIINLPGNGGSINPGGSGDSINLGGDDDSPGNNDGVTTNTEYVIQFMSMSFQSSAQQQLVKIKNKYGQYLQGYKPMIDVVNHPEEDGKKMYRVNFGIFKNKDEADQLCLKLLAHVDDCIPQERGGSIYVNVN